MPEAAVDEDDGVVFREHDIGASGEILPVETEAEASGMKHFPDHDFRFGVAAPDAGHYPGSLWIGSVRLRFHRDSALVNCLDIQLRTPLDAGNPGY